MESNQSVRVRIAPSPTGNLHVGTARAALFNELFALHEHGTFIIRIEDTDIARSEHAYEDNILEGLTWLGLVWQEGPVVHSQEEIGEHGPYRQSKRIDSHINALETLLAEKKAYYCFCPPQTPENPRDTTCACAKEMRAPKEGEACAIRLLVTPQEITFTDVVRGEVKVHTDSFGGDFAIGKCSQDGKLTPLFHLAVVVDDADMNITHVIRGDDHISNTPKHILIQRALGHAQPTYAHLPLLLDNKRRKLSKRNGETSLMAYRDMGILPEAMLNYLALLGWNAGDDREFYTHAELAQSFSIERVQKGGAVFDIEKLKAVNSHYIRNLSPEDFLARTAGFLGEHNTTSHVYDFSNTEYWTKALTTEQTRISTLSELPELLSYFLPDWNPEYLAKDLVWKKSTPDATKDILGQLIEFLSALSLEDFNAPTFEATLMAWIDDKGLGRGDVLWPMRYALSGRSASPSPFEIAQVKGKEKVIQELTHALNLL